MELTRDLYVFTAGLSPKESHSEGTEISTGTSGTTVAPSDPAVVNNGAGINKYARRLNKYKAGQSPATVYLERARSSQPGLSWLGDDEFESTGLAFRLARHQVQRMTVSKPTGGFGSSKNASGNADLGSGPRGNNEKGRTRTKASEKIDNRASQPRRDLAQKSQPRRVYAMKSEIPRIVKPSASTGPAISHPTLKPTPAPQTPVRPLQVDLESTDFTSLFGASPSLSAVPSSTNTKTTPADNVSRRVQLALEHHGGDYSRLISGSLVTSQGDPSVYAESTMARRRDLGPNRRNSALGIVRGMIGKSQGSQPTA